MDRFIISYNGNKYQETKKHLLNHVATDVDYIAEPFCGIFGFSRAYFLNNPDSDVKYLLNDTNKELIDLYINLKNDYDGVIKKINIFIESDDFQKHEDTGKEFNKFMKKQDFIIQNMFRTMCQGIFNKKNVSRIKNFVAKRDIYTKFFKKCEFYCLDYTDFMEIVNQKKCLVYYDPPYFNSYNLAYQLSKEDNEYYDGTKMYLDILKYFESNNKCIMVLNQIAVIDKLFEKYIKTRYSGVYSNLSKNIKRHVIYSNY